MKNLLTLALSSAALLALTLPVLAGGIHEKAASTSHALEHAATDLHGHMHHAHPSSYGAHGMETAAAAAHDTLHDYDHGNATVQDVLAAVDDANAAFDSMSAAFYENGVLTGPGQDKEAKKIFQDVKKNLAKLNAYVASAN